jgi:hypothetical protein
VSWFARVAAISETWPRPKRRGLFVGASVNAATVGLGDIFRLFFIKTFPSNMVLMPEDEDNRARANRCLQLAREACTLEIRHRWVQQAEFWFRLSERDTEPELAKQPPQGAK